MTKMVVKPSHKCHKKDYCTCDIQGDDPREDCEIHGSGEYPPRCCECGRFIKLVQYWEPIDEPNNWNP